MRVDEFLCRALGQVGQGTRCLLDGGRTLGPGPRGETGGCDCSSVTCWALGLWKYQPRLACLKPISDGWLNTNGIWWGATREKAGCYEQISAPLPGCLGAYPSAPLNRGNALKAGHTSVASQVSSTGWRAAHCCSGRLKSTGDLIEATGPKVFLNRKDTFRAWPAMIERPKLPRN